MSVRTVAIARGVAVIGGTAALIAGVTFAAFQTNTVTLAENSLATSSDNLQIYDPIAGFTVNPTNGYALTLVPGIESAKKPFYLKNLSGANLGLTAHLGAGITNTGVTDYAKVKVRFYDGTGALLADTDINALNGGQIPFTSPAGDLAAGAQGNAGVPATNGNYAVSFEITPDGVAGTSATVNHINLEFTGTATTPAPISVP